jgi:hypothetical protein
LGTHIGFQAISNNQKYWLIRWLAIRIVASGGTKFIGANLTNADFTQANLTHTDFSNANLTRTRWLQAEGLDFARREVASSYEIVELSVGDSINPQSAAIALQQLAQKYPDKFELLAIEGGGENNLKFHAKVTETETPLQLSDKLNQIYRQIQLLPDTTKEQILLEEKDRYVDRLENLLTKAIEKPNYYFETEGNVTMTQNKGNVNITGTQGNISGIVAAGENQNMTGVAIGAISGSVTNTINQLPETSQSEQPNLKELLTQLQKAIETETELPNEDKAEALEQVKTLAEAGQTPQDSNLQKAAKTAFSVFKNFKIPILNIEIFFYLPDKKLNKREIFLHSLIIAEEKKEVRYYIYTALFYLKFKNELRSIKNEVLDNIKRIHAYFIGSRNLPITYNESQVFLIRELSNEYI